MNKKKISALILSCAISSQIILPTLNASATELNNTNNKTIENSTSKHNTSNLEGINSNKVLEKNNTQEITGNLIKEKNTENKSKKVNEEKIKQNETKKVVNKDQNKKVKTKTTNGLRASEIVTIPDANLKKVLNEKLNQSENSDITKSQLESITSLYATHKFISNLEGLQYCTNLNSLNLNDNQISDISSLKTLKNLKFLDVKRQTITSKPVSTSNGNIEADNIIKGINNEFIVPTKINNNGIYDKNSNKLKWDKLGSWINHVEYSFDTSIIVGSVNINFSGDVWMQVNFNEKPVIHAENKTIKVGSKFNLMDGVTATDKEDGNITNKIKVVESTVNLSKPGTYKVVYEVTDSHDEKTRKTITVTIVSNDKPVISGIDNVTIKEGTVFNPMTGVTAKDTEDGTITNKVRVEGKVDTNKAGKYELTYTVTDTDGNTTTVKRVVTVIANTENINEKPVIHAENKTIKVGSKFDLMDGVSATDKEDGNITNKIKVVESTVNLSKPGTYKVVYEVTDSHDEKTRKTITVTVVSNDKPIISRIDNVTIKEGTVFNPMTGVTAKDTEDGTITNKVRVEGKVDTNKAGKYELTYTVTDTDGNTTTVKRVVTVIANTENINEKPVIHAENKTIKVGSKFDLMDGVSATDKEDGNITNKIKVVESTVNLSKPGTYKVVYEVTDSHDEKTRKTITVTVVSDNKPISNESNDTTNNNNPTTNESTSTSNDKVTLPATGATSSLPLIGSILVGIGGLFASKKKNNNKI
ncbi:immunoglobulin-like domain-containing protein [Clostridium baratii]|uniref:immunoglobulin-like domain-containing protein n=1 Tax=Clostridium baratii TaxID=1561 RepID=UPI0030D4EBC2